MQKRVKCFPLIVDTALLPVALIFWIQSTVENSATEVSESDQSKKSRLILSCKTFIERLSQYWLIRGAFSAETPVEKEVLRKRWDAEEMPDISLARSRGGRPFQEGGTSHSKSACHAHKHQGVLPARFYRHSELECWHLPSGKAVEWLLDVAPSWRSSKQPSWLLYIRSYSDDWYHSHLFPEGGSRPQGCHWRQRSAGQYYPRSNRCQKQEFSFCIHCTRSLNLNPNTCSLIIN